MLRSLSSSPSQLHPSHSLCSVAHFAAPHLRSYRCSLLASCLLPTQARIDPGFVTVIMSSAISSLINPQSQSARQSARQTRTNPSRTSKTVGRSTFAYGHGSMGDTPPASSIPHGFYPALTHFTDAIIALPREFRRHNSLLKEVDAKAWALEENLLQLLKVSSESQAVPYPPNPAPIVAGVIREDVMPQVVPSVSDISCLGKLMKEG